MCRRTRLLCWRQLFAWCRKSLALENPGSGVSTTAFFYIGTLAILTVMLVGCRCHAECACPTTLLAGHGMIASTRSSISNATG